MINFLTLTLVICSCLGEGHVSLINSLADPRTSAFDVAALVSKYSDSELVEPLIDAIRHDDRFATGTAREFALRALAQTRGADGIIRLADPDQVNLLLNELPTLSIDAQLTVIPSLALVTPRFRTAVVDALTQHLPESEHQVALHSLDTLTRIADDRPQTLEFLRRVVQRTEQALPKAWSSAGKSDESLRDFSGRREEARSMLIGMAALAVFRASTHVSDELDWVEALPADSRPPVGRALVISLSDVQSGFYRSDEEIQRRWLDAATPALDAAFWDCCATFHARKMLTNQLTSNSARDAMTGLLRKALDAEVNTNTAEAIKELLDTPSQENR